jgi:hypothetical protein
MPTKDESEVVDPATHSRDYVPPPTPPAPLPTNPYDAPGGPRSPDPVEPAVTDPPPVPTPPAAPDEDWTADPERDRKATVRDRPAPRRR